MRTTIGGEDVRRSYSICSAVQDGTLRMAVKKAPGGVFSTWANEQIAPGQTIDVMPPLGHFNVPLAAGNRKHYLGFAAGSGITPLLSIVKTTLADRAAQPVHAVLRQPIVERGDVPGGAGRSRRTAFSTASA